MIGRIAELGADFVDFWEQHAEWSEKTFGFDHVRGPAGPTKHLKKECGEVLTAIAALHEHMGDTGRIVSLERARAVGSPVTQWEMERIDLTQKFRREVIDLFILIVDIARRGRIKPKDLVWEAMEKLKENEQREWPPQPEVIDYWDCAEVEHVRE